MVAIRYTWRYIITMGVLYDLQVRVRTPTPYQGYSERPTSMCTAPLAPTLHMTSANTYVRMTSPGRVLELNGFCIVFSPVHPRALRREVSAWHVA